MFPAASSNDSFKQWLTVTVFCAALKEAVRDARRLHKALGNPMSTWQDGKVVWVQPEDIKIDDDDSE